jgi:oligopeptide transport system substrate-binding protein
VTRSAIIPALLALVAGSALLAGCPGESKTLPIGGGPPPDTSTAAPKTTSTDWKAALQPQGDAWKKATQTFTFNNGAEPETLDPQIMTGVPEHRLANGLFEGLVSQHPETLQPVPGVAERWDVSADGLVYTFHLRANAMWSDGKPVTARDFHASWERALLPATASQYAYMLYPIKNAERFNKPGEAAPIAFDQVGIEVKDERTLVVTLERPCAYFLDLVAFETLMPVPMEVVKAHGDQWVRPEHIIGNGPFKLSEWLPNQRIVFVKNEHYWDKDFVKLERVVALPYEDMETAFKLYEQNECDWLNDVPIGKIDEIKRRADFYAAPYLGSYFYRLNVTKPPFNDARVRRALSMAIDRETITRDILKVGQVPATWFTPAMPGYQPPAGLPRDAEKAKALLAEAGYPNGEGFPPTELLYNTLESHKLVAENVAQQWKETLGITVSLRNSEWKVYLNDVQHLQYNIARAAWIGDYLDPNTFLDMFVTNGGNNNTGWSHAKYDQLIADASKELDAAKRTAILQEAERILIEQELPIIPVYIYVNKGLLKPTVNGWYENVRDHHPFQYLWMEPAQ